MIKPEQWIKQSDGFYVLNNEFNQYIATLMHDNSGWVLSMEGGGESLKSKNPERNPPFTEAEALLAERFDELLSWCDAYKVLAFAENRMD